jgi:hypothetical protein
MNFGGKRSPTHCQGVPTLPTLLWGSVVAPCTPFGGALGFSEGILGSAPLPTVRECQRSLAFFGGALQCSVHPFGGALACLSKFWVVEENQGKIPLILEISWIRI